MENNVWNLIDMVVAKGDEAVKNFTNEIFMSEHFAGAVEKIINTKGIVDRKVKVILNTMNVASKIDIDELNDRIRKLNRDLAKLQRMVEELHTTLQEQVEKEAAANPEQ